MSSSNSILGFYFELLFEKSIQIIKDSFIGNSTLRSKGYTYIQQTGYYMKEEMVEEDDIMPVFEIDIIEKKDFINRLMKFENLNIYKRIESEFLSTTSKSKKESILNDIYNDIQTLLKRTVSIDDDDNKLVELSLIDIITYLKDRYHSIIDYHNVYRYIIKESDITFFQNKDLRYSFYQDLYELAYTLYLIDDTEIEELDFINAFTSPKPQILENKVRFIKNNYVVAYFLESLKPFFNAFTHKAIEKSEVFLNKQNKPIKSNDIYASLSRGRNKIDEEKAKIDTYIFKLKEDYLK